MRWNCGGQFGAEPPYDLVVYLRESSESSVDGGWPSKDFSTHHGKESHWKKPQNATTNGPVNIVENHGGRERNIYIKNVLKIENQMYYNIKMHNCAQYLSLGLINISIN